MRIKTSSGSVYDCKITPKGLQVSKGDYTTMAIAVYPNRLSYLEATVKVEVSGKRHEGFNANGVRTLSFDVTQIRKGMILANRKGFRSTEIVSVEY